MLLSGFLREHLCYRPLFQQQKRKRWKEEMPPKRFSLTHLSYRRSQQYFQGYRLIKRKETQVM